MKTAISLLGRLFQAAEFLAKCMGISRNDLPQRAPQAYPQNHKDVGVTEGLDVVYTHESEEAQVDPLLERLQLHSLPKDEWS